MHNVLGPDAKALAVKVPLSAQLHPRDKPWTISTAYSRLSYWWLWPLLKRGRANALATEDIWSVPRFLTARVVGKQAEELWRSECEARAAAGEAPRLHRVLLRLAWRPLLGFNAGSMACFVAFMVAPEAQRLFLLGLQSGAGALELACWGALFSFCWAAIALSVCVAKWNSQDVGMLWRLAAQRLTYNACLAMPLDGAAGTQSPTNLMSVDAERFFSVLNGWMPHAFLLVGAFPLLLIAQLGVVPAAACMASTFCTMAVQKCIARRIAKGRRQVMAEVDQRLQLTEQYLEGVRVLKMNAWTEVARRRTAEVRAAELRHHRRVLLWKGINMAIGLASPCLAGFFMICSYALLGGRMSPEVVFPALTILRALQIFLGAIPQAFSSLAEFFTAYERIQSFISASPLPTTKSAGSSRRGTGAVSLSQVVLVRGGEAGSPATTPSIRSSCGGLAKAPAAEGSTFRLGPVDLSLKAGDLCVVCGPVGSGKSTLLLGLLGELRPEEGGELSLEGGVALCGQEPWIRSATLRENVRCLREEDAAGYEAALSAAQLRPDLAMLPAGDLTEIGARGINVSGGQKARVALARVAFGAGAADVVLLDDVLSAVDAHVARALVAEVLLGALRGRTRVLVANTFLPLLLPHADAVVVLGESGTVDAVGPPKAALQNSAWLRRAVETMGGCDLSALKLDGSHAGTGTGTAASATAAAAAAAAAAKQQTLAQAPAPEGPKLAGDGSLLIEEERAVGVLSARAYASYFREATTARSLGAGAAVFAAVLALACLAEAGRTATELWVTRWAQEETAAGGDAVPGGRGFWVGGYAVLLLVLLTFSIARAVVFTGAVISASSRTHDAMLQRVLGASVPLFFDVVPMGRILNRFSKDLDAMDSQLPEAMSEFLQAAFYVVAIAAVCVLGTWYSGLALLPLLALFVYIRNFFGATSRELKRLEAISRSPLYVHFQETMSGLVHIRAFGLADRMLEEFEQKIDRNGSLFFHQYALVPWLMCNVNCIAAALVGAIIVVAVCLRGQMDASLVGLSLASGAGLLGRLHQCVSFSIETENFFTSVERLDHFRRVRQEEEEGTKSVAASVGVLPGNAWPARGEVVFEGVELRYRPHLPLVLRGVSFRVPAGQRAGLVGRTGSGKSSCMLALLRLVELEGGSVLIDGVDVRTVPLSVLRGRAVSIIPQDPVLFAGSLRENLDPTGGTSAGTCTEALQRTQLASLAEGPEGVDARIELRGANLSTGQRQLLCIARAMLRGTKVVLLDEASANIDANTDVQIQRNIRSCFEGSTLLVIAHRLSTVADADLILYMDGGLVVEAGSPEELRCAGGAAARLFESVGEAATGAQGAASTGCLAGASAWLRQHL